LLGLALFPNNPFCKKRDGYMCYLFEEDYFLLLEADKRLKDNKITISMDVILKNFRIRKIYYFRF